MRRHNGEYWSPRPASRVPISFAGFNFACACACTITRACRQAGTLICSIFEVFKLFFWTPSPAQIAPPVGARVSSKASSGSGAPSLKMPSVNETAVIGTVQSDPAWVSHGSRINRTQSVGPLTTTYPREWALLQAELRGGVDKERVVAEPGIVSPDELDAAGPRVCSCTRLHCAHGWSRVRNVVHREARRHERSVMQSRHSSKCSKGAVIAVVLRHRFDRQSARTFAMPPPAARTCLLSE